MKKKSKKKDLHFFSDLQSGPDCREVGVHRVISSKREKMTKNSNSFYLFITIWYEYMFYLSDEKKMSYYTIEWFKFYPNIT